MRSVLLAMVILKFGVIWLADAEYPKCVCHLSSSTVVSLTPSYCITSVMSPDFVSYCKVTMCYILLMDFLPS